MHFSEDSKCMKKSSCELQIQRSHKELSVVDVLRASNPGMQHDQIICAMQTDGEDEDDADADV